MSRKLLIGIDEAGYGPNIGPLVIGASVWDLPADLELENLAEFLVPEFQALPGNNQGLFIPFGDSKCLYRSKSSIRPLSVGVRTLADLAENDLAIEPLVRDVSPQTDCPRWERLPWYESNEGINEELFPNLSQVEQTAVDAGRAKLESLDIKLLCLASKIIDEETFNQGVESHGNKAGLLSTESVQLAKSCVERYVDRDSRRYQSIFFDCDKHGGRNRYQALLFQAFPDEWFHALEESTDISRYQSQFHGLPTNWSFRAKGDRCVAPAAASMIAKWSREVLLERLNKFWQEKCPGLVPTAGYPVDAKRFAADIQSAVKQLSLSDSSWWRSC
jgi:hypothetical protein